MNIADDRPEYSGLTKALLIIGLVWLFAILAGSFWWAMNAIRANHLGQWVAMAATATYMAAVLGGVWIAYRVGRRMSDCVATAAMDRYRRRQMITAIVYVVLLFVAIWVHPLVEVRTALAYALAVLPALPVVGMVVSMGLYLRDEADEFERAVHVEGALWATGGVLAATTVWGFAELLAGAPRLPLYLLVPGWAAMFSFGLMASRRRFR